MTADDGVYFPGAIADEIYNHTAVRVITGQIFLDLPCFVMSFIPERKFLYNHRGVKGSPWFDGCNSHKHRKLFYIGVFK